MTKEELEERKNKRSNPVEAAQVPEEVVTVPVEAAQVPEEVVTVPEETDEPKALFLVTDELSGSQKIETVLTTTAKVVKCNTLNIRLLPDIKSDVLGQLSVGEIVDICLSKSTDDWYAVIGEVSGYCMRKYINVEE